MFDINVVNIIPNKYDKIVFNYDDLLVNTINTCTT